jgi:hypothetical protein
MHGDGVKGIEGENGGECYKRIEVIFPPLDVTKQKIP